MAACQTASGDGYVGAVPGGKPFWADIRAGKIDATNFSINGRWVPWYNLHKLFAGLRDAWLVGGNAQARDVLMRTNRLHRRAFLALGRNWSQRWRTPSGPARRSNCPLGRARR